MEEKNMSKYMSLTFMDIPQDLAHEIIIHAMHVARGFSFSVHYEDPIIEGESNA